MRNTPLAVVEFDRELRVSGWSGQAERVFGWEASEVLGRPMWEIPWICEEDRDKVKAIAAGLTSGEKLRSVSPNRNVRKDGKVIWCEWYNSSLTDATEKMQSVQSLVLDVTQRKESGGGAGAEQGGFGAAGGGTDGAVAGDGGRARAFFLYDHARFEGAAAGNARLCGAGPAVMR